MEVETVKPEGVKSLFEPHYVDISDAFKKAFKTYSKVIKLYQNMYTPNRFKSDIIRTKVVGILSKKFKQKYPSSKIKIIENFKKDMITIVVGGVFALRIKKIDRGLRPKFNRTKESYDFIQQQHELFPTIATLVLGYMPNPAWSECSLYIIHPQQVWASFPITEQMIQEQIEKEKAKTLALPKPQSLPDETIIKRTKTDKKKKYGTD